MADAGQDEAECARFGAVVCGPFLAAREALPHLPATHGRIVNIGSLEGLRASAGHAHYCATKAGASHAHPGHGQGIRARGEGELRRAGLDRPGGRSTRPGGAVRRLISPEAQRDVRGGG